MSDQSNGPGWWLASDGKWYSPEQEPNYAPPPPADDAPPSPSFATNRMRTPAPGPRKHAGASSFSFDMKRWKQGERITAIATLVLLVSLFLPWFTYSFGLGSVSVNGLWHGWMYLVFLLCLAILFYLVSRAGFSEMPYTFPMGEEQLLLIGTGVNAVLTILAFLFKPGGIGFTGVGWGFGALVGLVASIVAAAPLALPAMKARRA